MSAIHLTTPLHYEDLQKLKAGDRVTLSGIIFAARDVAHRRMIEALDRGAPLPFELDGAVIYYVGPTPPPPGLPIAWMPMHPGSMPLVLPPAWAKENEAQSCAPRCRNTAAYISAPRAEQPRCWRAISRRRKSSPTRNSDRKRYTA